MTDGFENIFLWEFAKGANDVGYTSGYHVIPGAKKSADSYAKIAEYIRQDEFPEKRPAPYSAPSHGGGLEVYVKSGRQICAIRLANASDKALDTNAKYGPSASPVVTLGLGIPGLIANVALRYWDGKKINVKKADEMPSRIDKVPNDAWLTFEVDSTQLGDLGLSALDVSDGVPLARVPLYFNFYDKNYKLPFWALDHDHGHDHDHDHDSGTKEGDAHASGGGSASPLHGGWHPPGTAHPSAVLLYMHGGWHPPGTAHPNASAMVVLRDGEFQMLRHGGWHPPGLVQSLIITT